MSSDHRASGVMRKQSSESAASIIKVSKTHPTHVIIGQINCMINKGFYFKMPKSIVCRLIITISEHRGLVKTDNSLQSMQRKGIGAVTE